MIFTRRAMLASLAAVPFASRASAATATPLLGSISGNDLTALWRFATWFGRKPQLALVAFNQTNLTQLSSSTSYICSIALRFMALGPRILWSVPCPGAGQLEAIAAGKHDALYRAIMKQILAVSPGTSSPILVRLPWEFNLKGQQNAAVDRYGKWNAPLFVAAWRRIATITRQVSPRFQRIWCPNVTTMSLDPALCWPGVDYVEVVSQDFYMQRAYNRPGDFKWFRDEPRGLGWAATFAKNKGKRYGLSEWGMDSDIFADDLTAAAAWLKALGAHIHHHCWWDRPEVIDCRISDGTHPRLAAIYKQQFA